MGVGEEREICFEENGIITLKEGVVIYVEEDKFKVISSDRKEVVHFDKSGKVIDKSPFIPESNGFNDFGCLKYFEKMGRKERKAVKHWLNFQKAKNEKEEAFLIIVKQATKEVQYGYHIATIGASFDGNKIYYCENDKSSIELSENEWVEKAEEFAPQYGSRLATMFELFYWYAYKIAKGDLTLEEVQIDPQKNIIVLRQI